MKPIYQTIVEENKIETVRVKGTTIVVNGSKEYKFNDKRVASAVAKKVRYFVGV